MADKDKKELEEDKKAENAEVSEDKEDKKKFGEVSEEDIEKAKEGEPEDIKKTGKVDIVNEIMEWAESFVFAMLIVILAFTFVFRIVMVDGPSMNNTLQDGDRVILTYLNYTPEREDIVVVNSEVLDKTLIKRVVGVEGDDVIIDYNTDTVTVNGVKFTNDHNKEPMFDTYLFDMDYQVSDGVYEYKVPDNCIFIMGDNRNNSKDSRSIGFVSEDTVMGKVIFRLYPLQSFGTLK